MATPTPTASPGLLPTATPTPTPTATSSPPPTVAPTSTATPSPSPTVEPTPTPMATPTASPSPTATAKPTATPSPTATPIPISKPSDRVEFGQLGNVVSAKVVFEKTIPPKQEDIWLIVAYIKDGTLQKAVCPSLTDMTASFIVPKELEDCKIRVYVWDKTMKPLMEVQKIEI